jgi:membrane protease YdiL (CAAX protease family)
MDEKFVCHRLRREFDKVGLTLVLYYLLMTFMVFAAILVQQVFLIFQSDTLSDEEIQSRILANGWGYILAIAVGCVILLLWKKPYFCLKTIWKKNRPMTVGDFLMLLCVFLSGQTFFFGFSSLMEFLSNLMGFSINESIESASSIGNSVTLFLYGCILAPIFEEVLFRGLLLRMMEPYGKKFAVFATALLFGLFHANIVQSPFAFVVGLVLGYVTVEYGMIWSVVLHFINNFVLGDLLYRLTSNLEPWVSDVIYLGIISICTVVTVILMVVKRRQIMDYLLTKRIHPWSMKSFFTSPGILAFMILMVLNILLTLVLQILA